MDLGMVIHVDPMTVLETLVPGELRYVLYDFFLDIPSGKLT